MDSGLIVTFIGLLILGGAAFFIFRKRQKEVDTYYERAFNDVWDLQWSKNVPATMDKNADGTFSFVFPNKDGVHYITSPNPPVKKGKTITMRFRIEGAGIFTPDPTNPGTPAIRLFIQRKKDNMAMDGYRWWSKFLMEIPNAPTGDLVLSAKLDYANWSGLYGESADKDDKTKKWFDDCLSDISCAGFTFGASFAGHGVWATSGSPKFTLLSYTIE